MGLALFSCSKVNSNVASAGLDWNQNSDGCCWVVTPISSGASTSRVTASPPLPREPPVTRTEEALPVFGRNFTVAAELVWAETKLVAEAHRRTTARNDFSPGSEDTWLFIWCKIQFDSAELGNGNNTVLYPDWP